MLSAEENCADLVDPPTEIEKNHAITGNMGHVMAVMGAAKRFKTLLHNKRGRFMDGLSIFGQNSKLVAPPQPIEGTRSRSEEGDERKPMDQILATEGVHRPIEVDDGPEKLPRDFDKMAVQQDDEPLVDRVESERAPGETKGRYNQRMETLRHHPSISQNPEEHRQGLQKRSNTFPLEEHPKGHAHDPLEDRFFLNIGSNINQPQEHDDSDYLVVSESPSAVELNIYEKAYQEEMERIMSRRGRQPSMYMTRRVEHRDDIRALSSIKDAGKYAAKKAQATFDDLYAKGYTAGAAYGEAGRSAARAAAGRMHNRYWPDEPPTSPEGVDSVRDFATKAASAGYKNASETLGGLYNTYSKPGTKRQGLANLVASAQSKARSDAQAQAQAQAEPEIVSSPTEITPSTFPPTTSSESTEPAQAASSTLPKATESKARIPDVLPLGKGKGLL